MDSVFKFIADNTTLVVTGVVTVLVSIFVLPALVRVSKRAAVVRKQEKEMRATQPRQTVSFSGTQGMTTVTYTDLEVVQDPATGERFGAGERFDQEWIEKMRNPFTSSGTGNSKNCGGCGKKLPLEPVADVLENSYDFTGMKTFKIKIEAPFYLCAACGIKNIANLDEWMEADNTTQTNGKLVINM